MKRLLLCLAALVPVAGSCADALPAGSFNVTLEPKRTHEECAHLESGEKRTYYWRADGPVDFNVRYRQGDKSVYPLKRDGMRGDGGSFTAKSAEDYCWTWTARDRAVHLEGRIN